jgi:hypothetical protein
MKKESDRQRQVRRRGRMGKRSEITMLIVRMDPPGHPMTHSAKTARDHDQHKRRNCHAKGLRLASTASLFSLKDRFAASHCVT